jgi:integrase/recombinase XerD
MKKLHSLLTEIKDEAKNENVTITQEQAEKKSVRKQRTKPQISLRVTQEKECAIAEERLCFKREANYKTAVNSLLKFCGTDDLFMTDITATLMVRFQKWLLENGKSLNTVSCYMRSLRALYNKANKHKRRSLESPFDEVFTQNQPTIKRAASERDIAKLAKLELEEGSQHCLARDVFIFCFCAMGMPFVDLAYLKKSQIKNNVITYYRHKTNQKINIKVEPGMAAIMKRYDDPDSEYVFPVLANEGGDSFRHYSAAINRYNHTLKRLTEMAGLKTPLSSYVVRHTWASIAYKNGVEISVISKGLGHTSPTTTMIYVKGLNDDQLFSANKKIVKIVNVK